MRVAVYARYSSTTQRDASIEDQVRLCRDRRGCGRLVDCRDLRRPVDERRQPVPAGLPTPAGGRQGRQFDVVARRGARPAVARPGGRGRPVQGTALCRRAAGHAGRGRDQRAACRPQGHDERAVPEGPGGQDAIAACEAGSSRAARPAAALRLSGRAGDRRATASPSAAAASSTPARPRSSARIFTRVRQRRVAARHRPAPQWRRRARSRRAAVAGYHHPRPRRARHRHPAQRALYRPAGLEPAALHQGSRDRQAGGAAQPAERLDRPGRAGAAHRR